MSELPSHSAGLAQSQDRAFLDGERGTEWIVEAFDCDAGSLRDPGLVSDLCDAIVRDLGLNVLGRPLTHQFPSPGGITALYLLSESHLAVHTFPEYRMATFNLYCCRARPEWDWSGKLADVLGATSVETRRVLRGLPVSADVSSGRNR